MYTFFLMFSFCKEIQNIVCVYIYIYIYIIAEQKQILLFSNKCRITAISTYDKRDTILKLEPFFSNRQTHSNSKKPLLFSNIQQSAEIWQK